MSKQDELAQQFRALHEPGRPVILTNIHDAATAQAVGKNPAARAIATASYAVAGANGIEDDDMTLEQHLAALRLILPVATKSGKPVTVDLQDGYGERLEEAVEAVIDLGAVGINLEDYDRGSSRLLSTEEGAERIRRALRAAERKGIKNFVVNARPDVLLHDAGTMEDTIAKSKAYLDAGATTVYVVKRGGLTKDQIAQLVKALNGKINVGLGVSEGSLTVPEMKELGVARISFGPGLYLRMLAVYNELSNGLLTA